MREIQFIGRLVCRFTCLLPLFLAPVVCRAQVATVDVLVTRDNGSPAVGDVVELRNHDTGFRRDAASGATGRAHFDAVPAGSGYLIRIAGEELATNLQLRANESKSVAVTRLDTIVVKASRRSTQINAIDGEVASGFHAGELQNLPIEARDLSHALMRLPHVAPATGFFPEAPSISINGANGLFAQYLIDGMDNNENFLGGPKFPMSTGTIADVSVLAASYSAEYGRTGNGVVNVTTKSGTNDWSGEAFYLTRPGRPLDSSTDYPTRDLSGNSVKDGFHRDQGGFSIGGPLLRDRTFLFANVEYTRDRKDNLLSSPALGVNATVPGQNRSVLASLKIDHQVSDALHLTAFADRGDVQIQRQGGGLDGGATFPSAGSVQDRLSNRLGASAVYRWHDLTSETNFGYSTFRWNYGRPLGSSGPQVTVESPDGLTAAVVGNPGYVFDEFERSFQLQQKLTLSHGPHVVKVGADALHSHFALAGGGNVAGNYLVQLNAAELAAVQSLGRGAALGVNDIPVTATVLDYAVELRLARFGQSQAQLGLFAEDQYSVSPNLTFTAGLRWDYDSLSKAGASSAEKDNIAPRFSVAYRLRPTLALRGGAGLFYDRIPYTVLSDALQQNTTSPAFQSQLSQLIAKGLLPADTSLDRVTFDGNLTVNPPCPQGYLNCPTPASAADLRDTAISNERRILNPSGLQNPYAVQWSAGIQWQPRSDLTASADVVLAHGYHQLRLRDLNAPVAFLPDLANLTPANIALLESLPSDAQRVALAESLGLVRSVAAADATRPIALVPGGARKIIVTETAGESKYEALTLQLQKDRADDRYGYRIAYTLSRLTNNTDDINFRASNSNEFGNEWGPSVNDRRHVVSTILYLYPFETVTLSVAGLFQSGQPVNFIPNTAIYGTTDLNGDGASFSDAYLGNSDRATGVSRNSGRLPWSKTVDLGMRYAPHVRDGRFEMSADVFNLFNATNLSGFANSATQSNQIQIYGTPFTQRNAGAPRLFQFGVRYWF